MLITTCNIETKEGQALIGKSFVHYGCDELIAIQVELKNSLDKIKIKSILNENFPTVILCDSFQDITISFTDYPGYKVWACNLYKSFLRLCVFKNS